MFMFTPCMLLVLVFLLNSLLKCESFQVQRLKCESFQVQRLSVIRQQSLYKAKMLSRSNHIRLSVRQRTNSPLLGATTPSVPTSTFNDSQHNLVKGIWNNVGQINIPVLTKDGVIQKGLSSAIGYLLGDLFAQIMIKQVRMGRMLRMGLFGLLVHGSMGRLFYSWLLCKFDGFEKRTVAKRVLLEQVLLVPPMAVLLVLFNSTLRGFSPPMSCLNFLTMLVQKSVHLVVASWLLWPVAHFVNFHYIPRTRQLSFINSCQLLSTCLQSIVVNKY